MNNKIIEIYNVTDTFGMITRKKTLGPEIDLVEKYVAFKKEYYQDKGKHNLAIFIEPKIGNVYPDIVFAEFNQNNFDKWEDVRFSLTVLDIKVLYHIYSMCNIDNATIVEQLGLKWKDVALSTEKLIDSRMIVRNNKGWEIKDKRKVTLNKIEAIEAKINKWQDVLQQAVLNRNFASESYALMKQSKIPDREIVGQFKQLGVGLCLENLNEFKLISKPKSTELPVNFNSIYLNELIGRSLFLKEN